MIRVSKCLQQQASHVWRQNRRCLSKLLQWERVPREADWEQCRPAEWQKQFRRHLSTDDVHVWEQLADPKQVYLLQIEDDGGHDDAHEQTRVAECGQTEDDAGKCKIHQFLHFKEGTPLADAVARKWGYTGDAPVSFYIRRCYSVISDRITEWVALHKRIVVPVGVVLLGNPGISKTGFLVYRLWCTVVQNKENAIIRFKGQDNPFYAFKWVHSGSKLEVSSHLTLDSASEIFDSPPWFFRDSQTPDFETPVKCLVTCSPDTDNYSEFAKNDTIDLLYAPVWTLEEILVLNKQVFGLPPEKVKKRFGRWGGIPRFVLGKKDKYEILDEAIDQIANFQAVLQAVNTLAIDTVSHKIFHFDVNDMCTSYKATLASGYVSSRIYETANLRRSAELGERFAGIGEGTNASTYLAELFEEEFHSLIQEGHTYCVRGCAQKNSLGSPMKFARLPTQTWLMPGTGKQGAATEAIFPATVLDSPIYLRPMAKNNKGFDSIALYEKNDGTPARIFQVTISDNKNKNREVFASGISRALRYLADVRPGLAQVFFVVPEYRFGKFAFDPEKLGPEFAHVTFFVLLLDVRKAK